jgi:hypothetical protein
MPNPKALYLISNTVYDSKSASSSSGKGCAAAAASSASYLQYIENNIAPLSTSVSDKSLSSQTQFLDVVHPICTNTGSNQKQKVPRIEWYGKKENIYISEKV